MNQLFFSRLAGIGIILFGAGSGACSRAQAMDSGAKLDPIALCEEKIAAQSVDGESVEFLKNACKSAVIHETCNTSQGRSIFTVDRVGSDPKAKRILVLSMIHGDETASLELARFWVARIFRFSPKNSWRFIPMLNPDGVAARTRTNANGVDLNRNFPTERWDAEAHSYWMKHTKKDPRRNPGEVPGSEAEVRCLIKNHEDFKPDLVVSIHTPYGILDFDGPTRKPTGALPLPWKHLGTYPGSLGRYLWSERQVPVLTVELKGNIRGQTWALWAKLQDSLSFLAK